VITVVRADITTLRVDAIVNAANEALRGGGGVDGAIHRAAGPELLTALMQYSRCPTGEAVTTRGFRLPARYVIHTVGPIWRGGTHGEPRLLERAYESSFDRAKEQPDVGSIAFPAISTGIYGFPKPDAARIALSVMARRQGEFHEVIACLFDEPSADLYRRLMRDQLEAPADYS
jgi:O-acetyl-ADP-ribose deacetylase (regulator of RNase III)